VPQDGKHRVWGSSQGCIGVFASCSVNVFVRGMGGLDIICEVLVVINEVRTLIGVIFQWLL
jgi:hypothetical protein